MTAMVVTDLTVEYTVGDYVVRPLDNFATSSLCPTGSLSVPRVAR